MTLRMSKPRPTLMRAMATVPRPRKGRNSPKWAATAKRATAAIAAAAATSRCRPSATLTTKAAKAPIVRKSPWAKIGDALDAEDQRGADAGQGQDGAGDQPVDDELGELREVSVGHGGQRYCQHRCKRPGGDHWRYA